MQFALPSLSEYVPGPHVVKVKELVEAVPLLKVPACQSVQTAVPSIFAKAPGGHDEQEVDAVWLV